MAAVCFAIGPASSLVAPQDDEITGKLAMLIEGECEGLGPTRAAEKLGYSRQRYFQLRQLFTEQGAVGLRSQRRGPKRHYRRTAEMVPHFIRHRR